MHKQKRQERFDDSFYKLATEITKSLARNKDGTDQKAQVEELVDAERKFKDTVLKYRQATEIYKKFLQRICIQNKNILSARPYFREPATAFIAKITPAIKANDIDSLKTFDINYQLIKFIRDSWLGPFPKRAEQLFQRVHTARRILIENNMPLAINRAKRFYRATPRSHLSLMDLIEISAMGLAAGVDKYVGKYTRVFVSVCIGRMVGNMIEAYSETVVHFYPSDKRILYKANSIRGRQGITEISELTKAVNTSFFNDKNDGKTIPAGIPISSSDLSALMSAASTVSADATVNDEGFGVYHFTPDNTPSTEHFMVQSEQASSMILSAKKLPLLHRKILRLKGLKI